MSNLAFNFGTLWTLIPTLLAVLVVVLIPLSIWRSEVRTKRLAHLTHLYHQLIQSGLEQNLNSEAMAQSLGLPAANDYVRQEALRQAMQKHFLKISPAQKEQLVIAYCRLELANGDQDMCSSERWSVRLRGISNLALLDLKLAAPVFWHMRRDPNDLVASAAILAISGLKDELNNKGLLLEIRERMFSDLRMLSQLATNWIRIHGPQFVMDSLRWETRATVVKAFVVSLLKVTKPDDRQVIIQWLVTSQRDFESETLIYILRLLQETGDPVVSQVAKGCLEHTDANVRAAALHLYLSVSADRDDDLLQSIANDQSPPVQRIWNLHRGKIAA